MFPCNILQTTHESGSYLLQCQDLDGDSANPGATAIAIKDSLIVLRGDDYQSFVGTGTVVADMKGKMLVPGFIDNHTHFLDGGYFLANINLRHVNSREEFISAFHHFSDSAKNNSWILGGNWDHEAWGGQLPRKEWIDSVSYGHPVFVSRYDGHMVSPILQHYNLPASRKTRPILKVARL
ncbi:MAG: amidohydrolase family protein [Puia sp.]